MTNLSSFSVSSVMLALFMPSVLFSEVLLLIFDLFFFSGSGFELDVLADRLKSGHSLSG